MKDKITAKRQQAEAVFNSLIDKKSQKEQELRDIETELVRLQGEYRAYDGLLEEKEVSPTPDVINVDKALKGKK